MDKLLKGPKSGNNLYLPDALMKEVKCLADELDRSVSWVVARAIAEMLAGRDDIIDVPIIGKLDSKTDIGELIARKEQDSE